MYVILKAKFSIRSTENRGLYGAITDSVQFIIDIFKPEAVCFMNEEELRTIVFFILMDDAAELPLKTRSLYSNPDMNFDIKRVTKDYYLDLAGNVTAMAVNNFEHTAL